MPSFTTIVNSVIVVGASAAFAAPLSSVGDAVGLTRRHGGLHILGLALDDPCATLRQVYDHNRDCPPTDELHLFDELLGGYCRDDESRHESHRGGDVSSLLKSNLILLRRSPITKTRPGIALHEPILRGDVSSRSLLGNSDIRRIIGRSPITKRRPGIAVKDASVSYRLPGKLDTEKLDTEKLETANPKSIQNLVPGEEKKDDTRHEPRGTDIRYYGKRDASVELDHGSLNTPALADHRPRVRPSREPRSHRAGSGARGSGRRRGKGGRGHSRKNAPSGTRGSRVR
ncbi:hypothetical protein DXG03_003224 [Asterophora parasitica]|uniref:Uncharacterized protein n=1 Tax=Asterophora parasitica TaxID=117018 RepID=A0A9P7KFJ3_9AGAR|nr:hypothetical protein DXG03_003224 [Asterophora parasitica]